ncbi:MAG: flagellar biosynthesis protein FlhF, partial [Bacillota bacterium]|nr:flagellar biosynthesis protein FlhF [Bacillota bacterium]
MVIKKYIVNNMNEAMTRIRYELGKDAVIINQRKIKKPGFIGLFSKKIFEVTAAVENYEKKSNNDASMKKSIDALKKVMQKDFKVEETKKEKNETANNSSDIMNEITEIKKIISNMAEGNNNIEKRSELEEKLINNDINDKLAKKIIKRVNNLEDNLNETEKAKFVINDMIKTSNEEMKGSVVLIGPTGVGKTTTIAKLAGRLSLIEKKKVGLITIDTYRIGAVEQLRTYADIMNIPFKVVLTIKEMDSAIDSMKDCDVILVDTTGRSSRNKMQISELRAFV